MYAFKTNNLYNNSHYVNASSLEDMLLRNQLYLTVLWEEEITLLIN